MDKKNDLKTMTLGDVDCQRLIELGKGRELVFDRSETLVDILRRQTKELPDHAFLVFKDKVLTYKETDELTDRIAAYLISNGLEHEEAVGVMIGRSELMFVYSMAIMKAGGTYMPLDSHFPEDRLMFMCEDAGVKLILGDDGLVQKTLPAFTGTIFESSMIAGLPSADIAFPEVKAEDRMVILYTSGSTGLPKGVELEQHGLVNFCHWYAEEYELTPNDNVSAYANYGFDAHMMDMYPAMLAGATLHIIPEEVRLDLMEISEFISSHNITVAFFTTVIGCQLAEMFELKSLRVLTTGGEKMPPVEAKSYRFVNGYGPTECSIYSTTYDVTSHFEGEFVGRSIANYQLYIIDKNHNLVPEGESGELLIAGTGVARGYLNRPELTAEKFIEFRGQRAYRSGDLVRWAVDPRDGSKQIEFLGRIDGQVKLRGLRIELGEVENRVAAYPDILQVCVAVKEIGGQQNLVCYYTEKQTIDTDALRTFIGETLTAFMVPEIYVCMDALPLTPNGKVDRRALPVPEIKSEDCEVVPPATEMEQQLFTITSGLLKHNQFGVTTSLLSVGLTSLTAMRLSAMVKMQTGISLPSGMIMKTPTLRELAYLLTYGQEQASEEQIAKVHDKQEYYPLTENQRGLYIDWEMNHDGLQYNLPDVKVIKGHSAVELKAALEKVIAAHPILKMRLAQVDDEVVMHRRDEAELPIMCEELNEAPSAEFFQSRVRPFDLFNDDLCRIEIYTYNGRVFLFTDIHHIIYDGGSTFAFEGDTVKALNGEEVVTQAYTAYDRTLDEQEMHNMPMYEKAEQFFDTLMSQDYEVASYPHSAQPEGGMRGTKHAIALMECQKVMDYCQTKSITESNFFMTVVAQTLHRLVREENLLFTSITNGRMTPEMHDIIGMFVQTLPVISHVAKGSVVEAMRQMQDQYIQTQDNSIMPYTKVVEKYGVKSEIMFAFQGGAGTLLDKNEEDTQYAVTTDTAMFPLTIQIIPNGANYAIDIEYDANLYNQHDIDILAGCISNLATNIINSQEKSFRELSLVSDKEAETIINQSYGGDLAYNTEETLVDKVVNLAKVQPNHVAVVCSGESYTYAQLDDASNVIAQRLIDEGIQPGEFVCIMLSRRKDFVAAVLGVMKAGAAYVPVDKEYPEDRRQYMIEDSEAKVVITEEWLNKQTAENSQITSVNLTKTSGRAYMIYTSGTTGKPKGAIMLHKGLNAFIAWNNDRMHQTSETRHVVHASFSFDASIFDMLCPLAVGAEIHIINEDIRRDLDGMAQYISDHKISGMLVTTQVGMALLNTYDLPLQYMMVGGEKMLPVRKSDVRVINAYGPTEFTAASTYYDVKGDEDDIPIGRPVPNSYGFVVDCFGNLLPWGVAGELCMAGIQAGEGYWHRPDLTKEKFVQVPFPIPTVDASVMYHTGDLVHYDQNGDIIYCGRIDHQVKLRGFRIEMGEIESRAAAYDGITHAIAEVRKVNAQEMLCLYYTCKAGMTITADAMKQHLSASLTDYMVPDVYMQLDELPMTPGGKVNRKALPMPTIETAEYVAPETPVENQLADILASQLKHEKISVTANLISYGMTSLAAMRLSMLINKQMDASVKVKDLLQHPTIREIAVLCSTTSSESASTHVSLVSHPKQDFYPITENQRGLYIDWEMNRNTTQYNIPFLYKYDSVDADRLADAVRKVVDAHPYLKTRLINKDSDIMQQRRDEADVQVNIIELSEQPTMSYFESLVTPFDLLKEDLYRISIIKGQNAAETYLLFNFHHIIFDGTSYGLFMSQLLNAYQGKEIPQENYSAYDHALDEKAAMTPEYIAAAEQYFDKLLMGAETTAYPAIDKSPKVKNGKSHWNYIPTMIDGKDIDNYCKVNAVTPNVYFMSALIELLHKVAREESVCLTTIHHGRNAAQLAETFGFFVKTMPVIVNMPEHKTMASLTRICNQQYLESANYESYPYTSMVERYGLHPEFLYVYEDADMLPSDNADMLTGEVMTLPLDAPKMPIVLYIYNKANHEYEIGLEYDTNIYTVREMENLGKMLGTLAQSLTTAKSLAESSLLDQDEKHQLLELGKGRKLDFDLQQNLADMFVKQAQLTPDAPCVTCRERSLTYAEVDVITRRLASVLQDKYGVGPEVRVGVMIARSEWMVIYPLAVMRAGGAYMPLDSHFPADRLAFMCEDAGLKLILSEENLVAECVPQYSGEVFTTAETMALDDSVITPLKHHAGPENAMVVLYTSGSTGKPKGVVLELRNIVNFRHCYVQRLNITPDDVALAHASFGFDCHMLDIYPAVTSGASVLIVPDDLRLDMDALDIYMKEHKVTTAFFTTQLGCMYANAYDNPYLRAMIVAGEKMPYMKEPRFALINGYGPTECFYVTTDWVKGESDGTVIGRPLGNYLLYVVDKDMNLLPQGFAGELVVGGIGVSRGYLNREDLNAEKFISLNGGKAYRTGDLVRWNDSGELEYISRIDTMVKLRGFRIELGEIESKASAFEGIKQAVAEVRKERLVLYYTLEEGYALGEDELKTAFKATSLAEYMIPEVYVTMDKMPLTPNGKVNRKALPEPAVKMDEYVAPRNETEHIICEAFARLLGLKQVGIDDNFFLIGGNSLKMMKLQKECPTLSITTKMVLDGKTPRMIAEFLNQGENDNVIEKTMKEDYALSGVQMVAYTICQMNAGKAVFNVPLMYRLDNTFDMNRLAEAISKTINMHPAFGTRFFVREDGEVRQRYEKTNYVQNVETITEAQFAEIQGQLVQPFILLEDRMFRVRLFQTETAKYLFYDFHHIIYDGSSMGVFWKDVETFYLGNEAEPENWNMFELADENAELCHGDFFKEAKNWYAEAFKDAPESVYPTPDSNGAVSDMHIITQTLKVDGDAISTLCDKEQITMNALVSAASGLLLGKYCNTNDVLFQSMFSAREDSRSEHTIGCLATPLLMRMKWTETDTISEYLQCASRHILDCMRRCTVYTLLDMGNDLNIKPAMPIIYQGAGQSDDYTVAGNRIENIPIAGYEHGSAINVHVSLNSDGNLMATIYYLQNLYSESFITNFIKSLEDIINKLAVSKTIADVLTSK